MAEEGKRSSPEQAAVLQQATALTGQPKRNSVKMLRKSEGEVGQMESGS
jgi:hypothetical protein